jgi:hypothetical protein
MPINRHSADGTAKTRAIRSRSSARARGHLTRARHVFPEFGSRRFVVPKPRGAIVIAILSAVLVAGCGEPAETPKVDLTKTGETPELKSMLGEQMKSNLKVDKSAKPTTSP